MNNFLEQLLDLLLARLSQATYEEIARQIRLRAARLLALTAATTPTTTHATQEPQMAIPPSVLDALTQLDAATTAVGARIAALVSQIAVGMTQQDVDDLKARLSLEVTALNNLAADPNNPVPPVPPTP